MDGPPPDRAAIRVFPPAVPLAIVLLAVGLDRLWPIDPRWSIPTPYRYWIGGVIIAVSLLGLGAWSVFLLRRDGQSENPWKPTFRIIESGPFKLSRNPMYLQMVLVCLGIAIVTMNWWLLAFTPVCGWLLQVLAILPEEAYLERKFGTDFAAYKRRVRRWL
jgi:protein-S-isoprenylcysteine O-methyltransferase Ste14